jgi:FkbM family methyltransferase
MSAPSVRHAEPFATVDVRYAGRTVALPDLPEYRKFYAKLASGRWEPHTFDVLGRFLDGDTVLIDIGGWIGVTPMWSAQVARRVVAVDPDPKCARLLRGLAAGAGHVEVIEAALSDRDAVTIHAVDGFGSSETSVLPIGADGSASVPGVRMDALMARAGDDASFVKVDIEGYEYNLTAELARMTLWPVRAAQIALHPQLHERALRGPLVLRRLRTAWATWRMRALLGPDFLQPTLVKYRSLVTYILFGILLRPVPRGADIVFERRTGDRR